MSIANVLAIIDAEKMMKVYGKTGTATNPTSMGHDLYLTTSTPYVYTSNATGDLQMVIKAETETSIGAIRWRMASISLGFSYQCCIVRFNLNGGANLLTAPEQRSIPAKHFLPDEKQAGSYTSYPVPDRFWESRILGTGTILYNFVFAIVDRNGMTQGYYTYDPYIYAQ